MKHSRSYSHKRIVGEVWAKPLAEINSKLVRGVVRVHRGRLYYQSSSFPPKWNRGVEGYCNRFDYALRLDADVLAQKDVALVVLALVLDIDRELLWQRWRWPQAEPETAPSLTVSDWIASFKEAYWRKNERTDNREYLYSKQYGREFARLPQNVALTEQLLLDTLNRLKPGTKEMQLKAESRQRLMVSQWYGALADHAGLDSGAIRKAGKGWTQAQVEVRNLPSDAEAWATYEALAKWPEFQSGFLLYLLYGIRDHELVYCQPIGLDAEQPYIHVSNGKTGARDAYMLPAKEWPKVQWDGVVPEINLVRRDGKRRSHVEIGASIAKQYKQRGVPGTLYDYRHAYAVRGFEQGRNVGMMARSMGHSEAVHCRAYQSAVSRKQFQRGWQNQ